MSVYDSILLSLSSRNFNSGRFRTVTFASVTNLVGGSLNGLALITSGTFLSGTAYCFIILIITLTFSTSGAESMLTRYADRETKHLDTDEFSATRYLPYGIALSIALASIVISLYPYYYAL